MSSDEFDEQKYEEKKQLESDLLDEFIAHTKDDVEAINLAKASISLAVEGFKEKYGIDFSDDADDMIKDS